MRVGRALAAVCAGSVVALCGCSDDGEPTVLPTATTDEPTTTTTSAPVTATTTEVTAEPTPTTTLQLPDEHVPEVDAFVQEFFAAYNAAQDSRDLSAFDAMYLPQCAGCVEMRDELVAWLADDQTIEGADWVILQQTSYPQADRAGAAALAYRTAGTALGAPVETSAVQLFSFTAGSDGTWRALDMNFGDAE